jgi:hypothetical protein
MGPLMGNSDKVASGDTASSWLLTQRATTSIFAVPVGRHSGLIGFSLTQPRVQMHQQLQGRQLAV